MIRTLIIAIFTLPATIFLSSLTILVSLINRNGDLAYNITKTWAKFVLAVSRIKVTVQGSHNIRPDRSYIYMSNHQSNFDIPVALAYFPFKFRWVAKTELFKIPIFGNAMHRIGHISIDRSNRRAAFKSLKKAARNIQEGVSVLIYPEGTRSKDGNIGPFKNGGFVLAVESGASIVPVIIHGTWPIMSKDKILVKSGNVTIEIQKPIETKNYNRKTRDDLLKKVRNVICESFEKGKRGKL
ncbi:MAG: 1-acyl-sn-glycerol-3-phosphate acyltransferase [Deltaproteobacteria bacterium]|nr:1-acyl-sn-glycerol-3-phosphate acyltransferase [Deltaproteobacteria bacterium]